MYLFPDGVKIGHNETSHRVGDLVTLGSKNYAIINTIWEQNQTTYVLHEMPSVEPVGTIVFTEKSKNFRVMKQSWTEGQVIGAVKIEDLVEEKLCEPTWTKRYNLNNNIERIEVIKALRHINAPHLSTWALKDLKEWVESIWRNRLDIVIVSHE